MAQFKIQCLSHTPLMELLDPSQAVKDGAMAALKSLRESLERFDPTLIILFGPDHYNGFFYELMPPFCIGTRASSIGDYGTASGAVRVASEEALNCAEAVLAAGVDVAVSHRMQVDHGFAQPLALLTGGIARVPVIPIFINSVAVPLPGMQRARKLGEAVGQFATSLEGRILFMASGGLSHNPPVPLLKDAAPDVAERLIAGRNPGPEARKAREARTLAAARQFASGSSPLRPLNPQWDKEVLRLLESRHLDLFDAMSNAEIARDGGDSAHEVKAWVAANAAMAKATSGSYAVASTFYAAIPEWISGFATLEGSAV